MKNKNIHNKPEIFNSWTVIMSAFRHCFEFVETEAIYNYYKEHINPNADYSNPESWRGYIIFEIKSSIKTLDDFYKLAEHFPNFGLSMDAILNPLGSLAVSHKDYEPITRAKPLDHRWSRLYDGRKKYEVYDVGVLLIEASLINKYRLGL